MSSGTREDTITPITDAQARDLWSTMDTHKPSYGVCVTCRRRSPCHHRAEARTALILAGRLDQPRPATPGAS